MKERIKLTSEVLKKLKNNYLKEKIMAKQQGIGCKDLIDSEFNKNLSSDLAWLDDAFAKDSVDELEAACCLTEGQDKLLLSDDTYSYQMQIYPNLQRNFNTVFTWNLRGSGLLRFIDKAVLKNLPNLRITLLSKKCAEHFLNLSAEKQKKFIKYYPSLSQAFGLLVGDKDTKNNSIISDSSDTHSWVSDAQIIFKQLRKGREHLSHEQMSKLIQKQMQENVSLGNKKMTKRGGKKAPSAASILRHALQNLE